MGDFQRVKLGSYESPVDRTHQYRYLCARGFVEPGDIVIDGACGTGYGTAILSTVASKAIGMDRSEEAVKYAMEHNKRENNYFLSCNFDQTPEFPQCDVFVCIETFEHLRYPEAFAAKIKQSTRKKIFLTTPIVPTTATDPTHLHDFTEPQVHEIFHDENWHNIHSSIQGIYLLVAFYRKDADHTSR